MADFVGPPAGSTRNRPITQELKDILNAAADDTGIDLVRITSGGQPGTHGRRTGSSRHDGGRAADVQLVVGGVTKTFTDKNGGIAADFIEACAAYGATGLGAGVKYMGPRSIHVGFGRNASDKTKLVWGAKGKSATAPKWVKVAAEAGWSNPRKPGTVVQAQSPELPARFVVTAKPRLMLRAGPGLEFGISSMLATGTEVTVHSYGGANGDWALVDLEDDGNTDGFVFAAYLRSTTRVRPSAFEDADEPDEKG